MSIIIKYKKRLPKHQAGNNNSLGVEWDISSIESNTLSKEELDKLIEYRKKKEQESIENNDIDNSSWNTTPTNSPIEYEKLTDEEYFYVTGTDRRLDGKGPDTAKKRITEIAPKIPLNEDLYKNKNTYDSEVDKSFNTLKEKSTPDTSSNYKKDLDYTSEYVQWEYEDDILPHISSLQEQEKESYTPKAEEYIATTLKDLGFDATKLQGRAKLTRDQLYDNIKPEIIEILKSKGLDLQKVNWDKVAKYNDKKFGKRLDKVIKVANTNPLLPKASPKMIENKLIGILEKGRYKDPYEGLEENQIKVAEGLNGKIDENVRQDIIKDMKRGKSNQELLIKYKEDLKHIDVSAIKFKRGGVSNRDKEMVEGIADILTMIDDISNRKVIARKMIQDFKEEDVKFDKKAFLSKSKIKLESDKAIEEFKYGGKLEEDWINEYTIDGQKAKFFGNINGSSDVKFNRVAMIASRYDDIIAKVDKIIKEESPKTQLNPQTGNVETTQRYNLAVAFKLITQTGIRIGNEDSAEGFMSTYKEKGKEVLAHTYGLTTLLREHIRFRNGIAYLSFTGKKHVQNDFIISQKLSVLIKPIYDSKFPTVFNIDEYSLTHFIKQETSPYFSSKDFRTFRANVYANEKARHLPKPKIKKEYREVVNEVAEFVSEKLNNTPTVVKTSYIDGLLFWYYFGNPTEMPSKLPDPKKKEKKETGGAISSYNIMMQKGGNYSSNTSNKFNARKSKYNTIKKANLLLTEKELKFQDGTGSQTKEVEKKLGYNDWLKAITDINPIKRNDYNYIAAYNANMSPQDVISSYSSSVGIGTENQQTGEVLRKEGTDVFNKQVQDNLKVGFETFKGKDGKIYTKQSSTLDKDDSNVDDYIGTYDGGDLPEVSSSAQSEHWSKYKKEYEANNPLDIKAEAEKQFTTDTRTGIDRYIPQLPRTKQEIETNLTKEREEKSMDYVAQQLIKNNPQGDMSRAEWLNTLTPEEQDIVKRVSQNKPTIWTDAKRGIQAIGEGSSQEAIYNILNSKDYSNEEKVEMIKSYKDSPRLANILDMAKTAGVLNIPAKMVQSAYKDNYTIKDAIQGKQNDAGIIEDVVTDPLNLVGLGIWTKLSKVNKFASISDVYKTIKGLSKKDAIDKLTKLAEITQEEAVVKKANRMLNQKDKWRNQNIEELSQKFQLALDNHNPASDHDPASLGVNKGTTTEVSAEANLTDSNKARVAAHEVGHYYRNAADEADEWNTFFDLSKLNKRTRNYLKGKPIREEAINSNPSDLVIGKGKITAEGNGDELRERAGQLKDFIAQKRGIPLDQDFVITLDDFNYALDNYIKETGLDNSMTQFISAIKNKKGLLKMINKSALGTAGASTIYVESNKDGGIVDLVAFLKKGGTIKHLNKW